MVRRPSREPRWDLIGLLFWGLLKKLKSEPHCAVIIRPHKVSVSSIRSPFFIITELQKHFGQRNVRRPDVNKKKSRGRVAPESARSVWLLPRVDCKVSATLIGFVVVCLCCGVNSLLFFTTGFEQRLSFCFSPLRQFGAQRRWKNANLVQHTC